MKESSSLIITLFMVLLMMGAVFYVGWWINQEISEHITDGITINAPDLFIAVVLASVCFITILTFFYLATLSKEEKEKAESEDVKYVEGYDPLEPR
jgi:TRAP-type C4-dicarboxylate transport system permease small subunit